MKSCRKKISLVRHNEDGYVLIGVLFILILLIIVGLAGTTNTSLELKIAGNDRIHRETFYQADGGARLGIRLAAENFIFYRTAGYIPPVICASFKS